MIRQAPGQWLLASSKSQTGGMRELMWVVRVGG